MTQKRVRKKSDAATAYHRRMEKTVMPYYERRGSAGTLAGVGGTSIAYRQFAVPRERGAVLVLTGRSENQVRYAECAYELNARGYTACLMDHRGQGRSGRIATDPQKGHVERFDDYVDDALTVFDRVLVSPKKKRRCFMLGHSLGGLVAVLAALRAPAALAGVALSSPMFAVKTGGIPIGLTRALLALLDTLGQGEAYVPGQGPFDPNIAFEDNHWTGCRHRFDHNMALQRSDPSLNLGGPTVRWLREGIRAGRRALDGAAQLRVPAVLFEADHDEIVETDVNAAFCAAGSCTRISISNCRHELFSEQDEVVKTVLDETADFFDAC